MSLFVTLSRVNYSTDHHEHRTHIVKGVVKDMGYFFLKKYSRTYQKILDVGINDNERHLAFQ